MATAHPPVFLVDPLDRKEERAPESRRERASAALLPSSWPRLGITAGAIRLADLLVFGLWLAAVLYFAAHHEMWRDEVRALSLAIDPPTLADMLSAIHGEGHPALWYLILRAGYGLTGSMLVLPVSALVAAGAGMAWLMLRSPLGTGTKVLVAASYFGLFEYVVVARNYSLVPLPAFAFAALYDLHRRGGIWLGLILAVLANTTILATIVALVLLGTWLVETLVETGPRWTPQLRTWLVNAAIAGLGVAVAILISLGPRNDVIQAQAFVIDPVKVFWSIVSPGTAFAALAPMPTALISAMLFASLLAFRRNPALGLAGLGALLGLSAFFTAVYPGYYRHAALFLIVLLTLHWIAALRTSRADRPRVLSLPERIGQACLVLLLSVQVILSASQVTKLATTPWSSSMAAAAMIQSDPRLSGAVVMAEPGYLVEPLRYYGIDRTYLIRDGRFGNVVDFTMQARLDLNLGEILAEARRLKAETGREVVILLEDPLDGASPANRRRVGFNWTFSTDPAETAAFLDATERLARLGPTAKREDYDVYRLR